MALLLLNEVLFRLAGALSLLRLIQVSREDFGVLLSAAGRQRHREAH